MADSKVSELTAATSAAAADQLYLVQSSTSKSLTTANLFAAVATPASFNDVLAIGDHDVITAAGAISVATNVTFINNPSGAGSLTMTSGIDGQLKIIIMSSNAGSHTLTLAGGGIKNSIAFSAAGHSATMMYDVGTTSWYFIGGSATVT